LQTEALNALIVEQIDGMKGRDILVLDVAKKSNFASFMIIATGNSTRHVKSIGQAVALESRQAGVEPLGVEGNDIGEWTLVDLGDLIVHIMTDEARDRFQLEELWEK
jgi:ribosome-associated protein